MPDVTAFGHTLPDSGLVVALAGIAVLVPLVIFFVIIPLGLSRIFAALEVPRGRAWIPFVNLATVYRLGGYSEFWLIALVIPGVSIVGAIVLFLASHNINRRFGRGPWWTVLAVIWWWLWVLVLGFRRGLHEVAPSAAGAAPLVYRVSPDASLADRVVPSPAVPVPIQSAPVQPVQPVQPDPPVVPEQAVDERNTPTTLWSLPPGWAAPIVAPVAPAAPLVSEVPAAPAAPEATVAPATPEAEAPDASADDTILSPGRHIPVEDDGDAEATRIVARRRPWFLETARGQRLQLTGTAAVVGRNPKPRSAHPDAQLVVVEDPDKTVSGTHALLEYADGAWMVTDLGSTNGTIALTPEPVVGADAGQSAGPHQAPHAAAVELTPHRPSPVAPELMLGELRVRIVQDV